MQTRRSANRRGLRRAPVRRPPSTLLILAFVVAASALLALGGPLPPAWAWLIAANIVTLAIVGYDKAVAGGARTRVPERALLALSFIGGSPAAILGMLVFRHKTSKASFLKQFVGVLALQALAMLVALAVTRV